MKKINFSYLKTSYIVYVLLFTNLKKRTTFLSLNILNFLPQHYSDAIDFDKKFGQFKPEREEKLSFYKNRPNLIHSIKPILAYLLLYNKLYVY